MRYLSPVSGSPAPTQSAVIAPIAVADSVVGEHRDRFDAAARLGVPAHVTILYPFVEPAAIDEHVVTTLTATVGSVAAFDCTFSKTEWFGDDVLWLEPEPSEPFRRLTNAVWDAFPQQAPYGGEHDAVVPHLTVAERRLSDLPAMKAAEQAVLTGLPLSTHVGRVLLIAGSQAPRSWKVLREFALASGT